jgi:DNA gyrase subunit A
MEEVMHESMIPYSEYVILDRALPRVEDGLKPVQRRILFDMRELGITPDGAYKKCARVVGDCLGKYHPHGDTSVYGALVHLAQNFNMSCPLVDGQGNFGDIDGNGAAAMRYTECRLTPLAMEMLKGMGEPSDEIVKWNCNFDDTLKEPDVLPGRFPNLLVNGAYGIAIGFATNIPTHNLGEAIDAAIAYIDNRRISVDALMQKLKGPDFPSGGIIIAGEELKKAYETGKGRILIRAKVHYEPDSGDKKLIVIDELPYQVNRSELLKTIIAVRENKKGVLLGIQDVLDESDRSGMRIVIKVKKDYDPRAIADVLFKHTNLQTSFSINMVAIAEGKPLQLNLKQILEYYVNYQQKFIVRRTRCELDKAKKREHILEGLVVAVSNIDEVVRIIKSSKSTYEAKEGLKSAFALTDRQAEAILDLRLARLTHLEVDKIREELDTVRKLILKLSDILSSSRRQLEVVKEEMLEIKKNFKTPRRSDIIESVESYAISDGKADAVETLEDSVIMLSRRGFIKRMSEKAFSKANRSCLESSSATDSNYCVCRAVDGDKLFVFTDLGSCYKLDPSLIAESGWRGKGMAMKELVKEFGKAEKPVYIIAFNESKAPEGNLVFFTRCGLVKKSPIADYSVAKSSYLAVKLKDGDEVISIEREKAGTTMLFVTKDAMSLNAEMTDVPLTGRVSGGVKGITLSDDDAVVYAAQVTELGEVIVVTDNGFIKRVIVSDLDTMARARKGVRITDLKKCKAKVVIAAAFVTEPYDMLVEGETSVFVVNSEDVPIEERAKVGKQAFKEKIIDAYEYNTKINA